METKLIKSHNAIHTCVLYIHTYLHTLHTYKRWKMRCVVKNETENPNDTQIKTQF